MGEQLEPTQFTSVLRCKYCGMQIMIIDIIRSKGVCFRCATDIVTKPYISDHCKDCGTQMRLDTFASELVCPRCARVEEIDD